MDNTRQLTKPELDKLNHVLTDANFKEVSNARLEHIVKDGDTETEAILRYEPNTDARDAVLGALELSKAGLEINYDGNPETSEHGVDYDTSPISYVIMVRLPMWAG